MAAATWSRPSHHYQSQSLGNALNMEQDVGSVQLVPNPQFVFPMQPSQRSRTSSPVSRRPLSMRLEPLPHQGHRAQRQSVSTLPTFTFNATDTSGLIDGQAEPTSPSAVAGTPSKSMRHRRRASEFVGGDSRFGVSNMISTSPSKPPVMFPVPDTSSTTGSPARGRGHAHRRSAAISSHDLSSILQPRDVNVPPQMPSAPQTPTDRIISTEGFPFDKPLAGDKRHDTTVMEAQADPTSPRPPSRPRVGFSENVEYIPRPLSTVSSETTSSASTVRGHSFGNSISSVMSLGGVGSPSPRRTRTPSPMDIVIPPLPGNRLSLEMLGAEPSDQTSRGQSKRPLSESAATSPNLSITIDAPTTPRLPPRKKNFLRLDRRRSEPLISVGGFAHSRLSSVSLQEPIVFDNDSQLQEPLSQELRRKSSRKKVKDWATAFLGRKPRDPKKKSPTMAPSDASMGSTPGDLTPQAETFTYAEPEPDLDALFSQDPFSVDEPMDDSFSPRIEISAPSDFSTFSAHRSGTEESPIIDLDEAFGPYIATSTSWEARAISSSGGRRQLHSDRLNKDFSGPGMHYQRRNEHRRTESAPASAFIPFEYGRSTSPSQSPMADVFEEEEEVVQEQEAHTVEDTPYADEEEAGTGIQIVDAVSAGFGQSEFEWTFQDGLGIDQGEDDESSNTSFNMGAPQSTFLSDRRPSVMEDTIYEEPSSIEIVEDYEEPRTSSLTKSSDSSEASTVLADRAHIVLAVPSGEPSPLTPASYATSTFSSFDIDQAEDSFEGTRLGTSASSVADYRTISSCATGEPGLEARTSVDDVPSLTSSRSTMVSTMHASGRNFSDRSGSVASERADSERRRKRSSIQSLSKLVSDSRNRMTIDRRPQTAVASMTQQADGQKKKENRLSKLMFWKSKADARSDPLSK